VKYLIITADDFGLAPDLDRGIRQGIEQGLLSHVSLVANTNSLRESALFLKNQSKASAGIHLNLTDGKPLLETRSLRPLVDGSGRFLGLHRRVLLALIARPQLLRAVEEEWRAQIEAIRSWDLRVWQLNCHGHLHCFPRLFRLVIKLAHDYGIPFVRLLHEWPCISRLWHSPKRWFKSWTITVLSQMSRLLITDAGLTRLCPCRGVSDSGHLTMERFEEILGEFPIGITEFVCHPGYTTESVRQQFPWNYNWNGERELILSKRLKDEIHRLGMKLINFEQAHDLL